MNTSLRGHPSHVILLVCVQPTTRVHAGHCHGVQYAPRSVPETPPNALGFLRIPVQLRRLPVHAVAMTTPVCGSTLSLKPTELIPIPPARGVEGDAGGGSFDVLVLEVDLPHLPAARCPLSARCRSLRVLGQSRTRMRPSPEALLARGMSRSNFRTAYRVRGVVCMTRQQTFHRGGDGLWPPRLESMIRSEWPPSCIEAGLEYLQSLGQTVHVYTNSNPRRAPPGLYLASRLGTMSWSRYCSTEFMLLREGEVESAGGPR